MTNELLEFIKDKDEYARIAKISKKEDLLLAKQHQKLVNKYIRQAKASYIKDNLLSLKNDSKKFWRTIHEVVPNNKKKTSKTNLINQTTSTPIPSNEVSSFINNYFVSIGADLAKNFNSKWTYEGPTLPQMFNFNLITLDELNKQVCTINVVKSSVIPFISSRILKGALSAVPEVILKMYNQSILTDYFPDPWKIATVTPPLPKEGNPSDVNNLRPISLLPLQGKILERLIHVRLMKHLENNNFLTNVQGCFRPKHSTAQTTSKLTDDICDNMNNKKVTYMLFSLI